MSATAKRPFPLRQPTSITDLSAIRENDWLAFRQLSELGDHWTSKPWPPGTTGYYWYFTFDDPALVDLAAHCQKHLATEGFDPVPLDGLHLTVLTIGRTDDVADDQLASVADAARARLTGISPFDLSVGPLTGSRSALRFSVAPWDNLLEAHGLLREATAIVRPDTSLAQSSEFRPHIGIGYINSARPAARLIGEVAPLRDLSPVTVHVSQIKLVELRREERQYRWRDRAVIRFDD
jgi:2'-5' RNA ligase